MTRKVGVRARSSHLQVGVRGELPHERRVVLLQLARQAAYPRELQEAGHVVGARHRDANLRGGGARGEGAVAPPPNGRYKYDFRSFGSVVGQQSHGTSWLAQSKKC